jgi:hypothetical protein
MTTRTCTPAHVYACGCRLVRRCAGGPVAGCALLPDDVTSCVLLLLTQPVRELKQGPGEVGDGVGLQREGGMQIKLMASNILCHGELSDLCAIVSELPTKVHVHS